MNKNLKHAAKISLSVLGVLFIGSIFFYKERMLFVDAPFIFNIFQSQSLTAFLILFLNFYFCILKTKLCPSNP